MPSEADRKRLGELLDPMSRLPPSSIEDRRMEGPEMAPPYLGDPYQSQEALFLQQLAAEAKHREENPNKLQRDAGIMDIQTHPSTYFTMEDLLHYITPRPAIKGPR